MKRSRLQRKSPLRSKTALRKKSPQTVSKLQRDIWVLLRAKLRLKYPNKCYTCDRPNLEGANWHMGHLWAKASLGAYLKYDERVLRSQCYNCNIHYGGQGAEFYKRMLKEIGAKKMAQLEKDRQILVKARDHYEKLLNELKKI